MSDTFITVIYHGTPIKCMSLTVLYMYIVNV